MHIAVGGYALVYWYAVWVWIIAVLTSLHFTFTLMFLHVC